MDTSADDGTTRPSSSQGVFHTCKAVYYTTPYTPQGMVECYHEMGFDAGQDFVPRCSRSGGKCETTGIVYRHDVEPDQARQQYQSHYLLEMVLEDIATVHAIRDNRDQSYWVWKEDVSVCTYKPAARVIPAPALPVTPYVVGLKLCLLRCLLRDFSCIIEVIISIFLMFSLPHSCTTLRHHDPISNHETRPHTATPYPRQQLGVV